MASTPYCNVKIALPPGKPATPVGLQQIPKGATIDQIRTVVNNNFHQLTQVFNNFNEGNWTEVAGKRVTQRVKVTNPDDPEQFVMVDRINHLEMEDKSTGATWVWSR